MSSLLSGQRREKKRERKGKGQEDDGVWRDFPLGYLTVRIVWKNLPLMVAFAGVSMNIIDAAAAAAATARAACGAATTSATTRACCTGTADGGIVGNVILLHVEGVAAGRGAPHHAAGGGVQPVAVAVARR